MNLNQITVGDARVLAQHIPDASIDLIFTDPPYLKEHVSLYDWLGEEAARVLKPGGFLLAYVGSLWKYENMLQLGRHLTYFYDYVAMQTGPGTVLWCRRTVSRHKSIVAFVKGQGQPRCNVLSSWTGTGKDKRFHRWGQDESTARYFIDCFSEVGETVWEPFTGGGTVPWVCSQLQRNWVAFELEGTTAEVARRRLEVLQPCLLPEVAMSQPEQLRMDEMEVTR